MSPRKSTILRAVSAGPGGTELERLANGAPVAGRSVRSLTRFGAVSECPTARAAFVAAVDLDLILTGTTFEPEAGISVFAQRRGAQIERIVRDHGTYGPLLRIARESLGFAPVHAVVADLRSGYPLNHAGMLARADATREAVRRAVSGDPDAPNLFDHPVFVRTMGSYRFFFEADGAGFRPDPEQFNPAEYKSWPFVDGQPHSSDKLATVRRQMGMYDYLLADLVESVGGDPDTVSSRGLLVTPRNTGLQLVGTVVELARERLAAVHTLDSLPQPTDFAGGIPDGVSFGLAVAAPDRPAQERVDAVNKILDHFGCAYTQACLSSCGLAKLCREKTRAEGNPSVAGPAVAAELPGLSTLGRVSDLSRGAPALTGEIATGAAERILVAGRLYDLAAVHRRSA